jgi:thioredoxin reductase (NADPH)
MSTTSREVIIIGSGPAGLTAALYTARAGLKPLVLEGEMPGGQLTTTTEVENFPGFVEGIDGSELVATLKKQAQRFEAEFRWGSVAKISSRAGEFQLELQGGDLTSLTARAVIIATGARPRKLGLASEDRYWSKGVTSCATCDGFFYRGREVCVIGGGDSAMEEALFLTRFCPKVYIIHRRSQLRASKIMAARAENNPHIEFIWNRQVVEILGDETREGLQVTGVKLASTEKEESKTTEPYILPLEGVFLGIGHIPNTEFLRGVIDLDVEGYAVTQADSTATTTPGLFVCGDAQDKIYRQAITAAGTGCMAAIEAERYLESAGC